MSKRAKQLKVIEESPYFEVFALVAEEGKRSAALHQPWDRHTARGMVKLVQAELLEAEAAVELEQFTDTVRELIHTANTACKGAVALLRRGDL